MNYIDFKNTDCLDELPLWSAPFGLLLLKHIRYRQNITVLDIGFGTGFPLTEIAMRLGNTCRIIGIDPWKNAAKRAKRKIKNYRIQNIKLIIGEAENLPLENKCVDLIVSNNGTNNVTNLQRVFSECARVIKPGGQFIQTYNLNGTMMEFYSVFEKALSDHHMGDELQILKEHILKKRMPLDDFTGLLRQNGFSINKIEESNFSYTFTDGTSLFNHFLIRIAFLESWKKIVPGSKQKQIFDVIEKEINTITSTGNNFDLNIPFVMIDSIKTSV